ncbi:ATP-binding protein [Chelatococcus asaccharovorans]|uniref:ATP-binding protein n=1 Tax=Chelatococcus asaccharovorans TaxID=28210 RepID=UPI00224C7803|nr:AAA family ATPase [Chelatococcus asaccharovorans]CAH1662403.1 AAA_27 domain-containing protein [Chelatococcus asaccharovorans]CAH1690340.1 AAA_27 domain-containing protein [Chelatococcus asaccharovorans]
MRLRRLDLTRYGKFTDRSIDFGERVEGQPDLHVIYGPNEAGKSTAFAAFLDLLFGIGAQSPFDFLHPYSTMRIGGALEFGAEAREFSRIKRPQNSLLDAEGRPIAESAIRGELGGIERDAYRTMFSLDDETLEKGGESILASKGDLGQLLFSASAGLAHLSHKLLDLRGEADGFYRYRARSGALADLKARLTELKAERERFDTLASDHARLVETRDRARAHYDEAVTERTRTQSRMDEIQRHLAALPRLAALRGIRERLAPLADVPEAPPGWVSELPRLQKQEIELGVQTQAIAEDVGRLADEVEAIVVDEAALRLCEPVELLSELRARHVTAERDIPERRLQLRQADLAISAILQRIEREGEAEPRRLILTAATIGRLRELIEARSGIDAAIRTAAGELIEARRRLGETAAQLPEPGVDPQASQEHERSMAALAITVEQTRSADHHVRQRLADRARTVAVEALGDRLTALRPWQGTADDLVGLPCPGPDRMQRWKAARGEAEAMLARHQSETERLTTLVRHLEAERASLSSTTGVVTDQEAAEIRARREQAWAVHRRDLDAASADVFEAMLRHDDIIGAGRFSHMSELAKLHQSGQALAVARDDLDRAVELRDRTAAALDGLDAEVAEAVHAIAPSLASAPSLPALEDWLARREKALDARETVRSAEQDLRAAQLDAGAATERLRTALGRAGGLPQELDAGFDALLANAQAALDREAELRRLRAELDERRRDVALRERAAEKAGAGEGAWAEAWSATCRGCWLADTTEVPAIGVVREILVAIADLAPALEKRAGLVDRIEKMEKDQAAFRDEVASLAGALGIPVGTVPVLELAQRIGEKVREAGAEQDRRAKLIDRLQQARGRQRALAETSAIHDEQKHGMTAFFEVVSLAEVSDKLSEIARRTELRGQAEDAGREILDAVRAPDLQSAEAALDAADRPALEAELIELRARFEDQDKRCHELFATRSAAIDQVEAIVGDARVAGIEERRRTTLLEIEDGAVRYLQLRAGIAATDQALATYRERHRSSMMARASAAFRTISRGAYTGLAAQPGKDGETLIALSAAGGSKAAEELSKGTRFQLYLALRVAGYYEFVRARSAVPFVADDIMETFDDFRAEEAFRLFADMAQAGQVIYLTHHRHLCDIVQTVCPTVRLHRFDDVTGQRQIA